LRKDCKIPKDKIDLINQSLTILAEPLTRTHDYEEIFKQARRDSLTGLPNRLYFEEHIDCLIEQARRHEHPLTLAALDLDHFKTVNDSMGHLYGDKVLQQIASALQKQIRISDLLVRMGGDELLLVLTDTDLIAARFVGERLCRTVNDLKIKAGTEKLGISIGLAQLQRGMSKQEWLESADDMLYHAKKAGRNQVAHFKA
jgi:diguanylate cyclase (GGDEF)-like protein